MITAWKNGVKGMFSEKSWELMPPHKYGWEIQEAQIPTDEMSLPIEVTEFITANKPTIKELPEKTIYDDMSYAGLMEEAGKLGIKFKGRVSRQKLIEAINGNTSD